MIASALTLLVAFWNRNDLPGAIEFHPMLNDEPRQRPTDKKPLTVPYAGVEYRAQLTDRPESDAGSVLGKGGLEAAVSSRVLVFIEGGYGARLTRGEDDELQTRIVAEVGFRIRF